METEKQTVLQQALTELVSRIESTEKFVLDQAPEICKQIIFEKTVDQKYETRVNLIWGILLIILTGILLYSFHFAPNDQYDDWGILKVFSFIGTCISGVFSLISFQCFTFNLKERVLLKNCPKLYLMREFKRILE